MRYLFIFCIALFVGIGNLSAQSKVEWSPTPLSWKDFKKVRDDGSKTAATIYWELGFTYRTQGSRIDYEVECFTMNSKSWVKKGRESEKLLAHEQKHFDLAEVYARRMRQEFSKMTIRDNPRKLFDKLLKECENMQQRYDKESNHSMNKVKQIEWSARINSMLDETSDWAQ